MHINELKQGEGRGAGSAISGMVVSEGFSKEVTFKQRLNQMRKLAERSRPRRQQRVKALTWGGALCSANSKASAPTTWETHTKCSWREGCSPGRAGSPDSVWLWVFF